MPAAIQAVSFDVGGTLIEPWPSVGHIYAEVAERFGVRGASPERLTGQFLAAWTVRSDFDYSRSAWLALVEHSFAGLAEPLPAGCFEAIYDQFAEPDAWRIFPDVLPALEGLAKRGVRCAAISNWDERLEPLLERLGLRRHFECVVASWSVRCPKPHAAIFRHALKQLNLPAEAVLHIGDSRREDFEGARAVGLSARLLRRGEMPKAGEQLSSLSQLLALV